MNAKRSRILRSAWVLKLLRASVAPAIGGALMLVASPAAANITVNTKLDQLDADAACSLREAIQAINTAATVGGCVYDGTSVIDLPAGTYNLTIEGPNEDSNATGDLDVTQPITINGAGKPEVNGNGTDRVFHVLGSGTLTIDGLVITGGHVTATGIYDAYGGGIFTNGRPLVISNSDITNNVATAEANAYGGGIASGFASLTMTNCTVTGNEVETTGASAPYGGVGGGVWIKSGSNTITGSTISNNVANGNTSVGGVAVAYGTTAIIDSMISGNSATMAAGIGVKYRGSLTLTGSTVTNNVDGPGITAKYTTVRQGTYGPYTYPSSATLAISSSTITGNSVGGLKIASNGVANVVNSTFSGNGTAVKTVETGTVRLSHVTVTQNALGVESASSVQIKSSVITGNTVECSDANITSLGQNVFADATDCPTIGSDVGDNGAPDEVINPTLADNGGPTMTHALVLDSVAVDLAADCDDALAATVSVDQRGASRPLGDTCDSGAVEGLPTGEDCSDDLVCITGACVDGVCCESVCPDCQSCNVAGDEGTCKPDGTKVGDACGDSADNACDNPDSCNGSGVCVPNYEDEGLECGSDAESECSAADSCDGAGECSSNDEADGTTCADGECSAGECVESSAGGAGGESGGEGGSTSKGGSSSDAGAGAEGPAPTPSDDSEDDGGCGCTVPGKEPLDGRGFLAMAIAAVGLIGRRRRKSA